MTLSRGLLTFFLKQAAPATWCGAAALGLYSVFGPSVITSHDPWPLLVVLAFALALGATTGRVASPAFAFAHSRGFTRNAIWAHAMAAGVLSVLAVWLPAALVIWTGLRCRLQDRVFLNPNFPVMGPREIQAPWLWLALLVLGGAASHYAWIRAAQPTRRGLAGATVAVGMILALFVGFQMVHYLHGWFGWMAWGLYVGTLGAFLLGGRALYRTLEVRA